MKKIGAEYISILGDPDPNKPEEERKGGARELLQLVFTEYLPFSDLSQWEEDPEGFIENEDDSCFVSEYDLTSEGSLTSLASTFIEKLLEYFDNSCIEYICELVNKYFSGQLPLKNEFVEDALLHLIQMVSKVQRSSKSIQQVNIEHILSQLEVKIQSPLFRRRYLLIMTHWC